MHNLSKDNNKNVIQQSVQDVMRDHYVNYAYETIQERALPNVNDGLKPVHLRILYSMDQLGLGPDSKTVKSARVVGDVLGKYHPHGDAAAYGALIYQSQPWNMRYPTIYVHGNIGNVDGDPPAAMRYTETRLTKYGKAMLGDLNKDVVDFKPNFDDTLQEPCLLGTLLPNLLANGVATGIACGFATCIPPHNLNELYDAIMFMIKKAIAGEDYSAVELLKFISAPDFPTGGIITDTKDMIKAIETGKGKIPLRAKYEIKEDKKTKYIEITELPYGVNKLKLVEKIEDMIVDKKIEGLKEIQDSSSGDNIKIKITLKRDANVDLVVNNLLAKTDLRININYNVLAINNNKDILQVGILECLENFIIHSMDVIRRRSGYDLNKLNHDILLLEGIAKAIEDIDETIRIIRFEDDPAAKLQETFELEEEQVKHILDMRIARLSKASVEKISEDLSAMYDRLPILVSLTQDDEAILKQLLVEFGEMKAKYGDARRTTIELENDLVIEDLIKDESLIVTCTSDGNIKSVPTAEYNKQHRAGKGNKGADTKDDEIIVDLFTVNSKDDLLFITNKGRCHTVKAYKLPKTTRTGKGKNLANFVSMEEDEYPVKTLATNLTDKERYLVLVTNNGLIKRLALTQLSNKFSITKIIGLTDNEVVDAVLAKDDEEIMIITEKGLSLRFNSGTVRPSGRSARGVKGIRLDEDDQTLSLINIYEDCRIMTVTKYGIAKATNESEFSAKSRGCKGIQCHKLSDKTGEIVAAYLLDQSNILVGTANSKIIRIDSSNVAHSGRVTAGTKLINLDKDDYVVAAACLPEEPEEGTEADESNGAEK